MKNWKRKHLKGDAFPNFRMFQVQGIIVTTIMLKTVIKIFALVKKLNAVKIVVTCFAIYSLV